jgi:methylenetetrahydrofolate dehydrogenase (NADP+)/methenyltetrahydrofolate cyclohydrolase
MVNTKILSGKDLSMRIKEELKVEIKKLNGRGVYPKLVVIIIGEDPASQIYVRNKEKACKEVGIMSETIYLPENISQALLINKIKELNYRKDVNGILVQLPLPKHLNEEDVINAIDPKKDVDAFHPINVGKIMIGNYEFLPCTPAGIIELIKESKIDITGKNCVVVGRSNIVGKPMSMLLLHSNGTVTICHSKTENLEEIIKSADILVVAIGKPHFVNGSMIKEGAVIIDVGINRLEDKKICGDVDTESCMGIAGAITPVPGGVGPMTIIMLLKNTIKSAVLKEEKERYQQMVEECLELID